MSHRDRDFIFGAELAAMAEEDHRNLDKLTKQAHPNYFYCSGVVSYSMVLIEPHC